MPPIVPCANEPYCSNYVHKLGDLCDEYKRKERAQNYNEKEERRRKYNRHHKHTERNEG